MQQSYSQQYTTGAYLHNNPHWHADDAAFKAGKVLQVLGQRTTGLQHLAEVGCGTGDILLHLQQQLPAHVQLQGFDIAADAIKLAQPKSNERLQFTCTDFTQHQPAQPYDVLLVIDVIEHIENYFQFIRDIAPKARYTVFHIPLDMSLWTLFREQMLIESKQRVGHIHNFTEDFIKSVLTDAGYTIIDRLYTPALVQPKGFKQKMVEGLRSLLFKLSPRFCSKTMGWVSVMLLAENPVTPA
jgi:predicted TPR repeat methyltransferase